MLSRFVCVTFVLVLLAGSTLLAQDDPRSAYDSSLQPLVGAYRLPSGDPVVVRLAHGGGLVARDLETGVLVVLESRGTDRFGSGDSVSAGFVRNDDGSVGELRWSSAVGREVTAERRFRLVFAGYRVGHRDPLVWERSHRTKPA